MIDIVFLLIIFFLVSSHLARAEHHEAVDLSSSTSVTAGRAADPSAVILTIDATGQLRRAGQSVDVAETLPRESPSRRPPVLLRVDHRCRYQPLSRCLAELTDLGVRDIQIAVLPVDRR